MVNNDGAPPSAGPGVDLSVCIPAYNDVSSFSRALDSVLAQSGVHLECIVSDDSDTDSIERLVESKNDARIRYVRHTPALGVPQNWNAALRDAAGAIVTLLHQDDWYRSPAVFSDVKRAMDEEGADVLLCGRAFYADGACLGEYDNIAPLLETFVGDFPGRTLVVNRVGHPSVFFFRNKLKTVQYDEKIRYFVDTEYYMRLLSAAEKCVALARAHVALDRGGRLSAACLSDPGAMMEELLYVLKKYNAGALDRGAAASRFLASHMRHWLRQGPGAFFSLLGPLGWAERAVAAGVFPVFCVHMVYRMLYKRVCAKPWG